MDHQALDSLPRAYRVGLRLRALGADDALIADCLEVDVEAVITLLDIGARKLEQIEHAAPIFAAPVIGHESSVAGTETPGAEDSYRDPAARS